MSSALTSARQQATDWMRRGQGFEAEGSPDALEQAVIHYEQVIALLRAQPATEVARELGIACMNLGNALQKQNRTERAVAAYDEAIAQLRTFAVTDHAARNSLGAAWMNRGHALQASNLPGANAEALRSEDEAIRLLQTLPLAENPAYRDNLAGAWLNRAQALLDATTPDFTEIRTSLASVLDLTRSLEREQLNAADLSLKARHALCATLALQTSTVAAAYDRREVGDGGHRPPLQERRPESVALIAEIGDEIDAAMELVRHWEALQVRRFRRLAPALFRFGTRFYLTHQPQFLAEFVLENIDPSRAVGAAPDSAEIHAIAAEALSQALADSYNRRLASPAGTNAARLEELARSLNEAEARRAELQRGHAIRA